MLVFNDVEALLRLDDIRSNRQAHPLWNTMVLDIEIDTCHVLDINMYETAVRRDEAWYAVEVYENEEQAKAGHEEWVRRLTLSPNMDLIDIHANEALGS